MNFTCRVQNPNIPRAGRSEAHCGRRATSGRTAHRQNSSLEDKRFSKTSKRHRLNVSPEALTNEMLYKTCAITKSPIENRFIIDLSAGREALFVPRCPLVDQRHFCLVNLSNPKPAYTTGVSRRGGLRGGEARPGRTIRRQNSSLRKQSSLVPQKHRSHVFRTSRQKYE